MIDTFTRTLCRFQALSGEVQGIASDKTARWVDILPCAWKCNFDHVATGRMHDRYADNLNSVQNFRG